MNILQKLKTLFTRRNKKPEPRPLTESEIKWNKLWEFYGDDKLPVPVSYLCAYYSGIQGEGHYCFFDNIEPEAKTFVVELEKCLPKDLYDNFLYAFQIWEQQNGTGKQVSDTCRTADQYFFKNEQRVDALLQKCADAL